MKNSFNTLYLAVALSSSFSSSVYADSYSKQCLKDWVVKSDVAFATDCADMAFKGSLKEREKVAWMSFVRINQLIKDTTAKQGMTSSGHVPQWMAWATDSDTFSTFPTFEFTETNRDDLVPVTAKKLLAGGISLDDPDDSNEEVTRNVVSYEYITKTAKLNTKYGVLKYLKEGHRVDMPVGSVEIKASWLKVPPSGAPDEALVFAFKSGDYWLRGMHIMVKMQSLPENENLFYTEQPSWLWTTFEFNNNSGVEHVRKNFITQRAPLSSKDIKSILKEGGIAGAGFDAYSPNGTQIRFTKDGKGDKPVILGHTDMEDFAGGPNTAQPRYWTSFNSSCHSCHATAAINPETETYFPFTSPTGALTEQYYGPTTANGPNLYLGNGFVALDFMWPIVFHAK